MPAVERLELAERWAVRGAAFVLPLAWWPGMYDHYVLPKLLLARIGVLVLAAIFAAKAALTGRIGIVRTPIDMPLLAFIASALLSTALGVNLNVSTFGTYGRYDGLLTLCTYAALFWLVTQGTSDVGEARGHLRALLAGGYVVAIVAVIQFVHDAFGAPVIVRAFGTMGNSNFLGAYLALLIPLAYGELLRAGSAIGRALAANVLLAMLLALFVSLSRSAWFGLVVGCAVLLLGRQWPVLVKRWWLAGAIVAAVISAGVALVAVGHGFSALGVASSTDTIAQRVHVWRDSIHLIAARPLVGYGPDTFGLVYPGFQTGNWGQYMQFDKAHNEFLQVAATQGLVGVATYVWLLGALAMTFWRGRHLPGSWTLFAGLAAYETSLQLNFTALPAALPFWILAAAAVATWTGRQAASVPSVASRPARRASAAGSICAIALTLPGFVMPLVADTALQNAVAADNAGSPDGASQASIARQFAPEESVYAAEAGNLAFEHHDWASARSAYLTAIRLGSFNPQLFRNLAFTDRELGLRADAVAAARQAVWLDRFDPLNQAVLAQMEAQ